MLLLQEHLLNQRILSIKYNLFYPDVVKISSGKGKQTLVMMLFTRSHHAFPIAIPVLLLPKSSITKQVCSNSTFKVFPRISHLATALIHNFCTLHVAI